MEWTPEQIALRERLMPYWSRCGSEHLAADERAEFPWEAWKIIRQSGVLGVPLPKAHGGLGHDVTTTLCVLEALGHGCEDAGLNLAVATQLVSVATPLARFGSAALSERYLPGIADGSLLCAHAITEAESGSDAFSMRTRAVRAGDAYVIDGTKSFISNGPVADLFAIYARTDPERGALEGFSLFLVEKGTPGLEVGPALRKTALRTSPQCDLVLRECRVPVQQRIGKEGMGFMILDHVMKREIVWSFGLVVGEMQRRFEKCRVYAKQRRQFGQPIASFQAVANRIVDMKLGVTVSQALLYSAARALDRGRQAGVEVALAKLAASEWNVSSALHAMQIFGARSLLPEFGMEKGLRDAVAGTIYSGTSEIQRNKLASLLGL